MIHVLRVYEDDKIYNNVNLYYLKIATITKKVKNMGLSMLTPVGPRHLYRLLLTATADINCINRATSEACIYVQSS